MTPHFESLSVVYPAWNEEASIARAVDAARAVGRDLVAAGEIGRLEVVVVDDASTDRTGEILDALAAADPAVRVVHHEVNRKLGGAIRSGFGAATGELVLYTDADLPFDMADTAKAVRLLRVYDADVVSAYRFDRTGEGPRRMVYSHAYNQLVRSMFGLRVRDVNFAFKLVRRCVLDNMELVSEGSFIDVELLVRAHRLGYHIIQFGVDYFPRSRGVSTLSSNAVIARMLRELRDLRADLDGLTPLPPEQRRLMRETGP